MLEGVQHCSGVMPFFQTLENQTTEKSRELEEETLQVFAAEGKKRQAMVTVVCFRARITCLPVIQAIVVTHVTTQAIEVIVTWLLLHSYCYRLNNLRWE